VSLIDDSSSGWAVERLITFPVVQTRVYYYAFHRHSRVIALSSGSPAAIVSGNHNSPAVRIEKDLGWIKSQAVRGVERSPDSIGIELPRLHAGHERVPIVVRNIGPRIETDNA
jgi:hypothetical protein